MQLPRSAGSLPRRKLNLLCADAALRTKDRNENRRLGRAFLPDIVAYNRPPEKTNQKLAAGQVVFWGFVKWTPRAKQA